MPNRQEGASGTGAPDTSTMAGGFAALTDGRQTGDAHVSPAHLELKRRVTTACPAGPALAVEARHAVWRAGAAWARERPRPQILDLGHGFPPRREATPVPPAEMTLHEYVRSINSAARYVGVDNDRAAVGAMKRRVLAEDVQTAVFEADLTDPATVLQHADTDRLLDNSQPILVMFGLVTQVIVDPQDMDRIVETYRAWLAPGSRMVFTMPTASAPDKLGRELRQVQEIYLNPPGGLTPVAWELRPLGELSDILLSDQVCTSTGLVPVRRLRPDLEPVPCGTTEEDWGYAMAAIEVDVI